MVKFIKRLLGIDSLEERIAELEKSQTSHNYGEKRASASDNVLDEWINGKEENDE